MATVRHVSGLDWQMAETCHYHCPSLFCTNTNCCQHIAEFTFHYTFNHPTLFIPKLVQISGYENTIIKCVICGYKWRCVLDTDLHKITEIMSHIDEHRKTFHEIATVIAMGMSDETHPLQFLSQNDMIHIVRDYLGTSEGDEDDEGDDEIFD
jgi:hypothetical protein